MNLSLKYKYVLFLVLLWVVFVSMHLGAEQLGFKYDVGEQYKILSEVEEEVYINGRYSHQASILNRISVEVKDRRDGAGLLEGTFVTSESRSGQISVYELRNSYYSRFWRDKNGRYDIDPSYFMPVVRNVPIFPDGDVAVGDNWKETGEEVHDLRNGYGIPVPLRLPFRANYRYLGKAEYRGKIYDLLSVQYTVQHRTSEFFSRFSIYPVRISGYSDQQVFWDNEAGRPHAYTEQFSMIFSLSNGDEYEFTGTARAEITESIPMDKAGIAEEVEKRIEENGIKDAHVRIDEQGVTIDLENIQFGPDSVELLPEEVRKLRRIADILKLYPERHLRITGHTAMAGTPEGRERISQERARAVGQFLLDLGVRDRDAIITDGRGAEEPIADNSTPEGMRRNRRVEITILEN